MSGANHKTRNTFLIVALVLAGFFVLYAFIINYSADDGYIAFQYVKNLVNGHGLVYNVGERVEGYNDFLWLVLLAGLKLLLPGMGIPQIAQGVGVAFGAATILLVSRFSWTMRREEFPLALLAGAFIAVHSGFTAWSTAGLETPMFAFLIFAGAFAYIDFMQTNRRMWLVPVLFALSTMTRMDGLLFFGLTGAHALVLGLLRKDKKVWLRLFVWGLIFAAIYGPYFLWRYSYYGYLLPNIYYAKVGASLLQFLRGLRYLWAYGKIYGLFVFAPILLAAIRRPRLIWRDYFFLLVAFYTLYIVYVGGDGLAFHRFVAYIAPFIYVLVQEGVIELVQWARRAPFQLSSWRLAAPAVAFVAVSLFTTTRETALPMLFPDRYRWNEPDSSLSFPGVGSDHTYLWFDNYFVDRLAVAARWLEANSPPGATVASTPAGSIAYNMNLKVIDMLGLNDSHIARVPVKNPGKGRAGHEKGDGNYVLSRAPEFILMGNVAVMPFPLDMDSIEQRLSLKSEHELWANPEFHAEYELVCVQIADQGVLKYFTFFKRRDVALSVRLHDTLGTCSEQPTKVGSNQ